MVVTHYRALLSGPVCLQQIWVVVVVWLLLSCPVLRTWCCADAARQLPQTAAACLPRPAAMGDTGVAMLHIRHSNRLPALLWWLCCNLCLEVGTGGKLVQDSLHRVRAAALYMCVCCREVGRCVSVAARLSCEGCCQDHVLSWRLLTVAVGWALQSTVLH